MHCVSTRPSTLWVCIYSYCLEISLNSNAKPWFVFLVWNLLPIKWHHLAIIIILFLPCLACIISKHENCIQDFYSHIKHRNKSWWSPPAFLKFFSFGYRGILLVHFSRNVLLSLSQSLKNGKTSNYNYNYFASRFFKNSNHKFRVGLSQEATQRLLLQITLSRNVSKLN